MSSSAVPSNLIISLSNDKVTLDLSGLPDAGIVQWRTAFEVDGLFEEDKISHSIDELMISRPELLEPFRAVDVLMIDRPHINIPSQYTQPSKLSAIAARHLRARAGDALNLDHTGKGACICYTVPHATIQMLKEYFANITVMHFTSVLWNHLSTYHTSEDRQHVVYIHLFEDRLLVIGAKGNRLHFTKTFAIHDAADIVYYTVSCRNMLKAEKYIQLHMADEVNAFEMPGHTVLKIDEHMTLPALPNLLAAYRQCVS